VFPDPRNRSISTLSVEISDRFIAVGSALGDRGWIVGLRLGDALRHVTALPKDAAVPGTQQ
jgi:hypothetical protein